MPFHPHRPGWDAVDPGGGDEQACQLLAVPPAVGEGPGRPLQGAVAVFHLVADGVVDRLDLRPALEPLSERFGKLRHLRMAGLDVGARGKERLESLGRLRRDRELRGVGRSEDCRSPYGEGDDGLCLLAGWEVGNVDEHLLHAPRQGPVADLADVGREILADQFHRLLGPFSRDRQRSVDSPAGPPRGDDRKPDAVGLAANIPERRPARRQRFVGELAAGPRGRSPGPQTDSQAGGVEEAPPRHPRRRRRPTGSGGADGIHEGGIGPGGGGTVVGPVSIRSGNWG